MRYYIKSKVFKIKEDFWVKNDRGQDTYFIDNYNSAKILE